MLRLRAAVAGGERRHWGGEGPGGGGGGCAGAGAALMAAAAASEGDAAQEADGGVDHHDGWGDGDLGEELPDLGEDVRTVNAALPEMSHADAQHDAPSGDTTAVLMAAADEGEGAGATEGGDGWGDDGDWGDDDGWRDPPALITTLSTTPEVEPSKSAVVSADEPTVRSAVVSATPGAVAHPSMDEGRFGSGLFGSVLGGLLGEAVGGLKELASDVGGLGRQVTNSPRSEGL
jgi:hypothetical protein